MDADERHLLLWPPWLLNHEGPRYDQLSEESKEVWRKTRGLTNDANTLTAWIDQLENGIRKGLITRVEANQAIERVGNGHR